MIVNKKPENELNQVSEARRHLQRSDKKVNHRLFYNTVWAAGKTIMDIGCGIGLGTRVMADNSARTVLGLDMNWESINYCCGFPRMNVTYMQGNFFDFTKENPDARFDVVTAIEVVEHVRDYVRFLDEVKRITKETAYISTVINNTDEILSKDFHTQEWTEREFVDLLKERWETVAVYNSPGWLFHMAVCQGAKK